MFVCFVFSAKRSQIKVREISVLNLREMFFSIFKQKILSENFDEREREKNQFPGEKKPTNSSHFFANPD